MTTEFGWDLLGNMTSVTPPGKPAHGQEFDGLSRLAQYNAPSMTTVASTSTSFAYDADRDLRRVTQPGRVPVSYEKNDVGQLDHIALGPIQIGGRAIAYAHYASGEMGNGQAPGHVKHIAGPGAILSVSPLTVEQAAPKLTYKYDGSLLLSESYTGPFNGEVSRTYDSYLNVATQTVQLGQVTSVATFATDADGAITSAAISGVTPGLTAVYDPDQNYRLTGSSVGATTSVLSYDAYGALASIRYTSDSSTLFQAQYDTPLGGTPDAAVARDAQGRIGMAKETQGGETRNYSYAYDAAGRLTTVTQDNSVTESYHYDGNGNRTDALAGAGGTEYDAQDRLLTYAQYVGGAIKNWTFTYTDDGALSSLTDIATGQVTRYTYDELGNLVRVVLSDSTVIEYIIDGRGRRIGKRRNGALVKAWVYDGPSRIAAELDVATNVVARFVYGTKANIPDYMVKYIVTGATATVGGVYSIVSDHLGSPRMVVDANNPTTKLMEARYSAFGIPTLLNTGTLSAIPFGFAGGLYDADTGLVRFGARDYDPRFGRWTHKDPILFGGKQTNLYVYVGNDPVNFVDLTGLRQWSNTETEAILADYRNQIDTSSSLEKYWIMYNRHKGGGTDDYATNNSADTFCVRGQEISSADFGNFLAGYGAGYSLDPVANGAVRIMGGVFGLGAAAIGHGQWSVDMVFLGGDNTRSVLFIQGGTAIGAYDRLFR